MTPDSRLERMPGDPALRIENLTISFGGVSAVSGLSLAVPRGRVLSIIGPNGAGKTTVLNAISGLVRCRSGVIRYGGADLLRRPAWARSELGISRTFQNLQLFGSLTALENVMIGGHVRQRTGFVTGLIHWGWSSNEDARARKDARELLEIVGISSYARWPASALPLAAQKLLAVARALASRPRLLLLDEPAAGLVGGEIESLANLIRSLARDRGMTVVLVEHHMELVMMVSDHIVVMHEGRLLAEGDPAQIQSHPEVISVYLGTGSDAEPSVPESLES